MNRLSINEEVAVTQAREKQQPPNQASRQSSLSPDARLDWAAKNPVTIVC